ncbi:hypothetical protein K7V76_003144 [Vibrio fluvialis]|nr:hypothetical protein [Vibrio fluvialis]EKO3527563.1 hypothetical protein [Vibrio fluvialis]ELP3312368.1 hypothetical protein [Vibrio fluvialis]MBY8106386.1 hypothetical protein [Vibrio fluvialis]
MKSESKKVMLYKHGGNDRVWNMRAHTLVVDEADKEEYLEKGWLDHPSKLLEPKSTGSELKTAEELAELSAAELKAEIESGNYDKELLVKARGLEVEGKNRKTVIAVYDEALA